MIDVVGSPGEGSTHGFLFADLRGYTALLERHGAVEASYLLERYRALTREVVARHGGAEIKTEGDSFYVVLPSASAALRCGLDILTACREPPDGGDAIEVGVGIHAGESVAHEGGFVGSAVNIAARICSVAGAGELLASGTIRELTRSIVAASFVSIGRRQLKGLAEPVELFRVVREGAPVPAGRRRVAGKVRMLPSIGGWLVVTLAALAVVGLGGAIVAVQSRTGGESPSTAVPTSSAQPSASASISRLPRQSSDMNPVPVSPGTYAPNVNQDVASVTIFEPGWTLGDDTADLLDFYEFGGNGPLGIVGVARIQVVYSGPCPGDATRVIGNRPQDLIEWLQSAPQLKATTPRAVNDLGLSGIAIDATLGPAPVGGCPGRDPLNISVWQAVGSRLGRLPAGFHMVIEALNKGDRTLTVLLISPNAAELSTFAVGPGRRLLDSFVLR